jgi:hypothetical protein
MTLWASLIYIFAHQGNAKMRLVALFPHYLFTVMGASLLVGTIPTVVDEKEGLDFV